MIDDPSRSSPELESGLLALQERLGQVAQALGTQADVVEPHDTLATPRDMAAMLAGSLATLKALIEEDAEPAIVRRSLTEDQWQIVVDNSELVDSVLDRVSVGFPAHVDKDDLKSAGTEGLIDAVTRYDPEQGATFRTFAYQRVRGAMIDYTRKMDIVPRSSRAFGRKYQQALQELTVKFDRTPNEDELAEEIGIQVGTLRTHLEVLHKGVLLSLERNTFDEATDDNSLTLGDMLEDTREPNPSEIIEEREYFSIIHDAILSLPARNRYVTIAYFFYGYDSMQIAAKLGVTESRISQLWTESAELIARAVSSSYRDPSLDDKNETLGRAQRRKDSYVSQVTAKRDWKQRISRTLIPFES